MLKARAQWLDLLEKWFPNHILEILLGTGEPFESRNARTRMFWNNKKLLLDLALNAKFLWSSLATVLFFLFIQVLSNNSIGVQMSNAAIITNLQRGFYYW